MKRRIDIAALIILIIGAINLGLMGIFDLNVISWLFGGQTVIANRVIYVMVAIAGLWSINLVIFHGQVGSVVRDK